MLKERKIWHERDSGELKYRGWIAQKQQNKVKCKQSDSESVREVV